MKMAEIADGIDAHLKRFETDTAANTPRTRFYDAGAYAAGSRIHVKYISYQGHTSLTKPEAVSYLTWLNMGNVGRHFEALTPTHNSGSPSPPDQTDTGTRR